MLAMQRRHVGHPTGRYSWPLLVLTLLLSHPAVADNVLLAQVASPFGGSLDFPSSGDERPPGGDKPPSGVPVPWEKPLDLGAPIAELPATDGLPGRAPAAVGRPSTGTSPFQPPAMMLPRVLGMYPNELLQGASYSVSLKGENLSPTLKVDFGPGILVKGAPKLLHGGRLQLAIDVLPHAATGKRHLLLGTLFAKPTEQIAEFEVKQSTAKAKWAPAQTFQVKLPVAADPGNVFKGRIFLDAPAWRKQVGSQAPLKGPDGKPLGPPTPIYQDTHPTLDDNLLFIWHEQNKGVAERFEIRFFKGDRLLAKRDIPASSGLGWGSIPHYRPDAALIGELFQALNQPAVTIRPGGKARFGPGALGQNKVDLAKAVAISDLNVGTLEQEQALADVTWEVAGFKQYAKNGVAKAAQADLAGPLRLAAGFAPKAPAQLPTQVDAGKTGVGSLALTEWVDVEVEISERWPLYLPDAPTGLGCPQAVSGGVSVRNLDSVTQDGKLAGASGFPYDRFQLEGQFDLADSPYAAHASKSQHTVKPNPYTTVVASTTWRFDNVFIDWGDGTLEPLASTVQGNPGDYERGTAVKLEWNGEGQPHSHQYTGTGQYIVRVFQLGEDDIQGGAQQIAAMASDYTHLQMQPGGINAAWLGQSGGPQAAQAEVQFGQAVAKRAYMVFCQPLTIQHRTDPDANGPLKLVDIVVKGVTDAGGQAKAGNPVQGKLPGEALDNPVPGGQGTPAPTQAKLQQAQPGKLQPGLERIRTDFKALALSGDIPVYSSCDYQLTPYGYLRYTGQGEVRTRWYVDGLGLPPDAPRAVGPSAPRSDAMLKNPPATWGPPLASGVNLPGMAPVGLDKLGLHRLRVEAQVVADSAQLSGLTRAALRGDPDAMAAIKNAFKDENLPRLGVLAGPKVPLNGPGGVGPGPIMQLELKDAPIRYAAATTRFTPLRLKADTPSLDIDPASKKPPVWAVSEEQPYLVVGSDPAQPCTFDFPVKTGKFKVVGLQAPGGKPKVTRKGDRYSGSGELLVPIPGGGLQKAPLKFAGWQVADDGLTVLDGQFSITSPGLPELAMPAVKGRFTRLDGVAGNRVDAWLEAKLANTSLLGADGTVPKWSGIQAVLSPNGDWYADQLSLPELLIYDSGATIRPKSVVLDLSGQQGGVPSGQCGGGGQAWRGVHLGSGAELFLFNFDMPGKKPTAVVSDWGIDGDGLCGGQVTTGAESHAWLLGQIAWDGIQAKAWKGLFEATYQGLSVHAPWLDATLTGSGAPVLLAGQGQGQGGIQLDLKADPKTLVHGPVTLKASNLAFVKETLGGQALPAVRTDTCFDFQGESQVFAKDVCVNDLYFGFDGRAYFSGSTSRTVVLAGKSGKLAQGTVSLKEVGIHAATAGDERLRFDFKGDYRISQALPAVPMPATYLVREPATAQYSGSGPFTGSFKVPFRSQLVNADISPTYAGPTDGGSLAANPVRLALADLGYASDAPIVVALGQGDTILFKGSVDMSQFQSDLPLQGTFLLGYHGDTDFWATKFVMPLGPSGVTLVPGVISMYAFGGGLGYHVTRDSLRGGNLDHVEFSPGGDPTLNATATLGTTDGGFILTARGDLNIKTGGGDAGVDMTYDAWLLSTNHGGDGPIKGTLGYGGGAFFGTMEGKWAPPGLEDFLYIQAGPGAIGFSVGGDDWYFRAGDSDNPITGHVLVIDQGAWLNLSKTKGYHIGAKANERYPPGSCNGTCAYVEGWIKADAGITLNPANFSASGGGGVDARGCYKGTCVNYGTHVNLYGGAPNPYKLGFGLSVDLPCPAPDVDFDVKVWPNVGFGWSLDSCLW